MKKRNKIIVAILLLLVVCGIAGIKYLNYWITSQAYPDIWNRPEVLKNYRLHKGHLTFVFPASFKIIHGFGEAESAIGETGAEVENIEIQSNEIDFHEIHYGKYEFLLTVLNEGTTNLIQCNHYHMPNWSRDRIIIQSLDPLEYEFYSNDEPCDIDVVWTTLTNRTKASTVPENAP